jgi:hypothetical protein
METGLKFSFTYISKFGQRKRDPRCDGVTSYYARTLGIIE